MIWQPRSWGTGPVAWVCAAVVACSACGNAQASSDSPILTSDATVTEAPAEGAARTAQATPTSVATPTAEARPTEESTTTTEATTSAEVEATVTETVTVGETPRLVLPRAGIDQKILPGGLSDRGTISPPRDTLMWFDGNNRVAPGQPGTSLIAAHVKYGDDDDVFALLDQVEVGEEFTLVGPDDSTMGWRVTDVDVLDKGELQEDERVWGPQQDVARLALVTCDASLGFRQDGHRVANRLVLAERVG